MRASQFNNKLFGKHLLNKLSGKIIEVNLEKEMIQPLNKESLEKCENLSLANDFSDDMFKYAHQFKEADILAIAAPFADLSFPSMLKIYFEAVTINGLTFHYTSQGFPEGLTNIKKIIYITTAGGPIGEYTLGYDYLKALCNLMFSINDITCHSAEMLDIIDTHEDSILNDTIK